MTIARTIAMTREVSPGLARCELTHLRREPIDVERARAQHLAYRRLLEELGCGSIHLPADPELPDSVFVEDTAVVVDEVAILTRPGAESRRGESASTADALRPFREIVPIEAPGTLEGGDVLRIGKRIWVGLSSRTNAEGVEQLRNALEPRGYEITGVPVTRCLHLKSAVSQAGPDAVLLHPRWLPAEPFAGLERIETDASEPMAANGLLVDGVLVYPAAFPRTRERLEARGITVRGLDVSELAKAEGAVTCCSILFTAES
jgi:dimethylargininase